VRFPHCDQRILHAPGECEYCDMAPEWQQLRIDWGICFTGHNPDFTSTWVQCPADVARPVIKAVVDKTVLGLPITDERPAHEFWPGNAPQPPR
jgi:hypothetical protein